MYRYIRAFTLIELLVVVAIIALLATLMYAGFDRMQAKSRDTRRMEDLDQIAKALNLYFTDHFKFPKSSTNCVPGGWCDEVVIDGQNDPLSQALLDSQALRVVPTDPLYPDDIYKYRYQTDASGRMYVLRFCLETDSIPGYSQGCGNEKSN